MFLYIDIETLPSRASWVREEIAAGISCPGNYKKPESIAEWEKESKPKLVEEALAKTGLDGGYGCLCCLGWAVDNAPSQTLLLDDGGEALMLARFLEAIQPISNRGVIVVGHNVAGFDLKFLWQRCVVNGLFPGSILFQAMQAKPWDKSIADTMLMWHPQNKVSLTKLCKILGIEKNDPLDGSDVYDLWCAGEFAKVADHCRSDVEATRACHRKFMFQA